LVDHGLSVGEHPGLSCLHLLVHAGIRQRRTDEPTIDAMHGDGLGDVSVHASWWSSFGLVPV
jgi:hypothetical protein